MDSKVKSETKLVCEEIDVLQSAPPSSEGHTDENWNIHEIAETIPPVVMNWKKGEILSSDCLLSSLQ